MFRRHEKENIVWSRAIVIVRNMKNLLGGAVLFLVFTAVGLAQTGFWEQLTPDERAAAGLGELSPAQQKKLDELATRFSKEGARQAVEVAKVEARAEVEQAVKKREEARVGFVATKDEAEVIASKIAGTFKGWSGQTLFHLENGQTWVQSDKSEAYWLPAQPGPEVEIRKSSLGGWKLYIMPAGRWVRVKRSS